MRQLLVFVAVILLLTLGCTAAVETSGQNIDLEAERALLLEADRTQAEAYSTSETPLDTIFASFTDAKSWDDLAPTGKAPSNGKGNGKKS